MKTLCVLKRKQTCVNVNLIQFSIYTKTSGRASDWTSSLSESADRCHVFFSTDLNIWLRSISLCTLHWRLMWTGNWRNSRWAVQMSHGFTPVKTITRFHETPIRVTVEIYCKVGRDARAQDHISYQFLLYFKILIFYLFMRYYS